MPDKKLKIALQKSGRLSEPSVDLLKRCSIGFETGDGKLRSLANNFPVEILFLRDDDIPQYIEDGVADVGIVGENILKEKDAGVVRVEKLGFGRCRMALAVPRAFDFASIEDLNGQQ